MLRFCLVMELVGVLMSSAACGDDDDNRNNGGIPQSTGALRDAVVLGITGVVNQGEVDQANAALPRLTASSARDYANKMVTEHTQALAHGTQVAAELGIAPEASALSEQLKSQAQAVVATLAAGTPSPSYDRMYMQTQVDGHANVLDLIDTQLLPGARGQRMRTLLSDMRQHVEEHLTSAQAILQSLPTS